MSESPFVFWKEPGKNEISTIENPTVSLINEPILTEEGFILLPFKKSDIGYILKGKIKVVANVNIALSILTQDLVLDNTEELSYTNLVNKALTAIKDGSLQKVVLARSTTELLKPTFNINHFFEKLCEKYPNAMVYCLRANRDIWIGATPEIFINKKLNTFMTHALAGTLQQSSQKLFGAKEKKEQQLVKNYIVQILKKNEVQDLNISAKDELHTGTVKHLINKIEFSTPHIEKILGQLHPTPAVCGTPMTKSYEFISRNEKLEREFYSGYLGPIYGQNNFSFWVNLRCAKILKNTMKLFAGAGIVDKSMANDEWSETEYKINTLRDLL